VTLSMPPIARISIPATAKPSVQTKLTPGTMSWMVRSRPTPTVITRNRYGHGFHIAGHCLDLRNWRDDLKSCGCSSWKGGKRSPDITCPCGRWAERRGRFDLSQVRTADPFAAFRRPVPGGDRGPTVSSGSAACGNLRRSCSPGKRLAVRFESEGR
jgi:hypothetical protein